MVSWLPFLGNGSKKKQQASQPGQPYQYQGAGGQKAAQQPQQKSTYQKARQMIGGGTEQGGEPAHAGVRGESEILPGAQLPHVTLPTVQV